MARGRFAVGCAAVRRPAFPDHASARPGNPSSDQSVNVNGFESTLVPKAFVADTRQA